MKVDHSNDDNNENYILRMGNFPYAPPRSTNQLLARFPLTNKEIKLPSPPSSLLPVSRALSCSLRDVTERPAGQECLSLCGGKELGTDSVMFLQDCSCNVWFLFLFFLCLVLVFGYFFPFFVRIFRVYDFHFHFPSDICVWGCFFVRLVVVDRTFIPSISSYLILPLQLSLPPFSSLCLCPLPLLHVAGGASRSCWRSIALLTELDKGFVSRRRRESHGRSRRMLCFVQSFLLGCATVPIRSLVPAPTSSSSASALVPSVPFRQLRVPSSLICKVACHSAFLKGCFTYGSVVACQECSFSVILLVCLVIVFFICIFYLKALILLCFTLYIFVLCNVPSLRSDSYRSAGQ